MVSRMLSPKVLFSAILLSLPTLGTLPLRAEQSPPETPLVFLSNGVLGELSLNGKNLLKDHPEKNGLFVLYFDGIRLKEIRMENVVSENSTVKAVGPKGFPRLEFELTERGKTSFELRLTRVEGMPRTRDAALMLRADTQTVLPVKANGGAKARSEQRSLAVYWPALGTAQGEFGSVVFGH